MEVAAKFQNHNAVSYHDIYTSPTLIELMDIQEH